MPYLLYAQNRQSKVDWLKEHVINLDGIDLGKVAESSLKALDEVVQNKRVIVLSEQTHHDGGMLVAQAELLNYLHHKHNFNGLLIERGFHGTWQANSEIYAEKDSVAGVFMWLTHLSGHHLQRSDRLIAKIIEKSLVSDSPIMLGGTDILETSTYVNTTDSLLKQWIDMLPTELVSKAVADYDKFIDFRQRITRYDYFSSSKITRINYEIYYDLLCSLVAYVESIPESVLSAAQLEDRSYLIQSLNSQYHDHLYRKGYHLQEKHKLKYNPYNRMRDSIMANNLLFYLDSHPNMKFVVIVSSFHAAKAPPLYTKQYTGESVRPMLSIVAEEYCSQIYSIGAIRYSGYQGKNGTDWRTYKKIKPAKSNSMEALLHQTGVKAGLLDFSNRFVKESWLNSDQIMMQTERANKPRNWLQVYDGVLFIDEMTPDRMSTDISRIGLKQPY